MSILSKYIHANNAYNKGIDAIEKHADHLALREFNLALRFNPRYTLVFINRGRLYQEHGFVKKAAQDYEAALRLDPADNQIRYRLAVLYLHRSQFKLSIKHFKRIVQTIGWQSRPEILLADSMLRQQRFHKAADCFFQGLRRLDFH